MTLNDWENQFQEIYDRFPYAEEIWKAGREELIKDILHSAYNHTDKIDYDCLKEILNCKELDN